MPKPNPQLTAFCPFVGGIWPQEFYAHLNEAIDSLKAQQRAAQADGGTDIVAQIQGEIDELLVQRQRFRDQCASCVGMLIRIASEDFPGLIPYAIDKATIARIVTIEKDLDEMANALAKLQRGPK